MAAREGYESVLQRDLDRARSDWVPLAGGLAFSVELKNRAYDPKALLLRDVIVTLRSTGHDESRATVRSIRRLPPFAHQLRRGLVAEVEDGSTVEITRNWPRPFSVLRVVDIVGPGVAWRARGAWAGTRLEDQTTGELLFRSRLDRYQVRVTGADRQSALLLALIVAKIPQSVSWYWVPYGTGGIA